MQALMPSVTLKVCTKRVVREKKHLGVSQLSMFLWFLFWLYLPDLKHDYHVWDNRDTALPKSCLQHTGVGM